MGSWEYAVFFLFPIPFLSLLTLCVPLPHKIRALVNRILIKILDFTLLKKIGGSVNIYQICIGISSILFFLTCLETTRITSRTEDAVDFKSSEKLKCLKWRGERNFWISLFSLTLWLVLYRLHIIIKDLETYRKAANDHDKAQ